MEQNLIAAYKSLMAASKAPEFMSLPQQYHDGIKIQMEQIRSLLIVVGQKRVESQVDTALA